MDHDKSHRADTIDKGAEDAVTRYLEKKRRAEQTANEVFDRHFAKKELARQRMEDTVERVEEARRSAYEHMEQQADRIFELQELEAIDREKRIELLIARVRDSEKRLKQEIEQRAVLTLETVQLAKQQSLERIELLAEQAAAKFIEAKKLSTENNMAWIDEAIERIEIKRQQVRDEANRIAIEIVDRVQKQQRLIQLDVRERSAYLQGRKNGLMNDSDIAQYETGIIERFGTFLSEILGSLLRVPFEIVEALTGCEMIGRIGMNVGRSAERSGITAAKAIQGGADVIHGIVTDDEIKIRQGAQNLKEAGTRVITGFANSIEYTARNIGHVVSGDPSRMGRGVEGLITTTAVIAISAELALNLGDFDTMFGDDFTEVGMHHVEPHDVGGYTRADGTEVQPYHRGGLEGYDRTNPDGNPDNNLG